MLEFAEKNKLKPYLIISAVFIIVTILIGYRIDNDLWFILAQGREIESYGGLFPTDLLSMHTDMPVIIQQWLYDISMWEISKYLGLDGVWALSQLVGLGCLFLFFKISTLISTNRWNSLFITLVISIPLHFFIVTRPRVISNFLLLIAIYCLEKYVLTGNKKVLYALPLISCLLINIHAAIWPLLYCIGIAYVLDKLPCKDAEHTHFSIKPMIFAFLISFFAALVTPYGADMMTYVFNALGKNSELLTTMVTEMRPLNIKSTMFFFVLYLLIMLLYGFKKKRPYFRHAIICMGFTFLAFNVHRGCEQFYLFACLPLAYHYSDVDMWDWLVRRINFNRACLAILLFVALWFKGVNMAEIQGHLTSNVYIIATIILLGCVYAIIKHRIGYVLPSIALAGLFFVGTFSFTLNHSLSKFDGPVNAVLEYSSSTHEDVVLFTEYEIGALAEYRGLKPYMDPRAEVFCKSNNHVKDYLEEYRDVIFGITPYWEFLEEYGFNYLCVQDDDIMYHYLPLNDDYEIIYDEDEIRVFHKK